MKCVTFVCPSAAMASNSSGTVLGGIGGGRMTSSDDVVNDVDSTSAM